MAWVQSLVREVTWQPYISISISIYIYLYIYIGINRNISFNKRLYDKVEEISLKVGGKEEKKDSREKM